MYDKKLEIGTRLKPTKAHPMVVSKNSSVTGIWVVLDMHTTYAVLISDTGVKMTVTLDHDTSRLHHSVRHLWMAVPETTTYTSSVDAEIAQEIPRDKTSVLRKVKEGDQFTMTKEHPVVKQLNFPTDRVWTARRFVGDECVLEAGERETQARLTADGLLWYPEYWKRVDVRETPVPTPVVKSHRDIVVAAITHAISECPPDLNREAFICTMTRLLEAPVCESHVEALSQRIDVVIKSRIKYIREGNDTAYNEAVEKLKLKPPPTPTVHTRDFNKRWARR